MQKIWKRDNKDEVRQEEAKFVPQPTTGQIQLAEKVNKMAFSTLLVASNRSYPINIDW
jgi:hypothetical protein